MTVLEPEFGNRGVWEPGYDLILELRFPFLTGCLLTKTSSEEGVGGRGGERGLVGDTGGGGGGMYMYIH